MMPDQALPCIVDAANSLLSMPPGPAELLTGTEGPVVGVLTIRTPTTTLTVKLPREQVLAWGQMITELGQELEGSRLLVATPRNTLLRPLWTSPSPSTATAASWSCVTLRRSTRSTSPSTGCVTSSSR
jgi:hypothetical protein